jgi:hypothetical protein
VSKLCDFPGDLNLASKNPLEGGGVARVVEHLPSKYEAVSSNLSARKKKIVRSEGVNIF